MLRLTSRVSPLDHEVRYDPVKYRFVVITLSGQLGKVLTGLWSMVPIQLNRYVSHRGLQHHI